jgi:Fic family protein
MSFDPKYTITTVIAKALASIEVSKQAVIDLPITATVIASLRETARIASTHHSTAIEGNRLSMSEVRDVIIGRGHFPNRTKDEAEVRRYYNALNKVDILAQNEKPISEDDIKLLHGISFVGKNFQTPYRDGQNVIRAGRLVVYIPPKAEEVPQLMSELVAWINEMVLNALPIPFIAALAHYQFATIHPYYDGNGRTARLLATLILHKYGYGLKGIYALEEYYAKNLITYYDALTIGTDEDYYDGDRAQSDLTKFLEYFVCGMAESFENIRNQAKKSEIKSDIDHSHQLRDLNREQKQILKLFLTSKEISAKDISEFFQFSDKQARSLCQKWVASGFLEITNHAPKTRKYKLCEKYESLILSYGVN